MNPQIKAALAAGSASGVLAVVLGASMGWAILTGSAVAFGVKKLLEKS